MSAPLILGVPAFMPSFILAFIALALVLMNVPVRFVAATAGAAVLLAVVAGVLSPAGLLCVAVLMGLAAVASLERSQELLRLENLASVLLLLLCIALSLHIVPGFNNPRVVPETLVSADAVPYQVYWNFDKLMAGLALLVVIRHRQDLGLEARVRVSPILVSAVTIGLVMSLGWALGIVRFDPKLPSFLAWWVPSNLFITSHAEEAFFRGVLLALAVRALGRFRHGTPIGLILVSAVFGVAHIAGGIAYVALSTIAGLGYGLVYLATGRLAWSIGLHFSLNLTHLLLFTYPMLTQ